MVRDAEAHADEDRTAKDLVDARNQAEHLVYTTEKSLAEHGDKVDQGVRDTITAAIGDLRSSLEGGDAQAIRSKTTALQESSYKLAEAIYQQAQAADSGSGGAAGPDGPDEEIIEDAEVVDPDTAAKS